MARNLKGYRKIVVNDKTYHWKVRADYYSRIILAYDDDLNESWQITSDSFYGDITIQITPHLVAYCIENNIREFNNDWAKEFMQFRLREKKLNRLIGK